MRSAVRVLSLLAAALVLPGCQKGEPPATLRVELPEVITSKEPVLVRARATQQDGAVRELRSDLDFQVAPADLASVDQRGLLTCSRSGEGSVGLSVAGVSARAKFACKLAARLEAPAKISIDAASGPVNLQVSVLDAAGKELDLPVSVTSARPSVVTSQGGKLVPGSVGTARLTATVGALSRPIEVQVVRTLEPEVLPIDQNRRISYSLEAGKYRLSLVLPSAHPVKVDWLGAPYCAYRGEGTEHHVDCTLQSPGSVSFDNPAFLLRGDKTPSVEGVTLQEVP